MSFKSIVIVILASTLSFFLGIITQTHLEIIGPQSYEDCVIEGTKGAKDAYAIREIKKACRAKFPLPSPEDLLPASKELPGEVVQKIRVKGSPTGGADSETEPEDSPFAALLDEYLGNFKGSVYNGDREWTITSITLRLQDTRSKASIEYEAKVIIRPLQSEKYNIKAFEIPECYSISVVAARGCRE